ncbi:MAG: DUF3160 domain-containing protein, partial [Myxococcota bacterium]
MARSSVRVRIGVGLGIGGWILACAGPEAEVVAPPIPAPVPEVAPVSWPLVQVHPTDRAISAPPRGTVRIRRIAIGPAGDPIWTLVDRIDGTTAVHLGPTFTTPQLRGLEGSPVDLAVSPFDGALFVAVDDPAGHGIVRCDPAGDGYSCASIHRATRAITGLTTAYARWADQERLWFAQGIERGGGTQILSVRRDGSRRYEVTSPSGRPGELTDEALRVDRVDDGFVAPSVVAAASAVPVGLDPGTGTLWWRDGDGQLHARTWDPLGSNWDADAVVPGAWPDTCAASPNDGALLVCADETSVRIARPGGGFGFEVGLPSRRTGGAALAPNGRSLLVAVAGTDGPALISVPVEHPAAWIRGLARAALSDAELASLDAIGLVEEPTTRDNLFDVYDDLAYASRTPPPLFASIDGFLEVVNAAFLGVLLRSEREVAKPNLAAYFAAVEAEATAAHADRLVAYATTGRAMLAGDYTSPDGARALAEVTAGSAVHRGPIPWGSFRPRGPYADPDAGLADYFRAFQYANLIDPDPDELTILLHPPVVAAWRAWALAEAPFVQGSRHRALLDPDAPLAPYVRPDCLEVRVQDKPFQLLPLGWGIDHEILSSTIAREGVAADCAVPGRPTYTGLDLLAGLGSDAAAGLLADEIALHPGLAEAHARLRGRFASPIATDQVVTTWLRVVQLLADDGRVPSGVDPGRWRARLLETSLATWATYRHATVLLNEGTGAEAGEGGPAFEALSIEPARGAVDPVPEAWDAVARLLDQLAALAGSTRAPDRPPAD